MLDKLPNPRKQWLENGDDNEVMSGAAIMTLDSFKKALAHYDIKVRCPQLNADKAEIERKVTALAAQVQLQKDKLSHFQQYKGGQRGNGNHQRLRPHNEQSTKNGNAKQGPCSNCQDPRHDIHSCWLDGVVLVNFLNGSQLVEQDGRHFEEVDKQAPTQVTMQ
ncbi:hypothetical protein MP228_008625 [Amoeboaphelidium protococcarum]|nr:hypothetical protein MP228_008625 [Amoeboaphelidium protococcarum]